MMSNYDTPTVAYLATARLGEKGQVTVPKEYRDALALEVGAPMAIMQLGNGLLLIPEQARFRELCDRLTRIFASHGKTAADLLATLPPARERVFARHYPSTAGAKSRKQNKRA
jgi:bifunctional DNA-binding transcriptional regulator/antitoxin component of YhaV-PrlF toxin-antitoxin module